MRSLRHWSRQRKSRAVRKNRIHKLLRNPHIEQLEGRLLLSGSPPTAMNNGYGVFTHEILKVQAPGVLQNDTDPESDPLTARLVQDVLYGELTLYANGGFVYVPPETLPSGVYSDTFTYRAHDGTSESNTATVTINLQNSSNVTQVGSDHPEVCPTCSENQQIQAGFGQIVEPNTGLTNVTGQAQPIFHADVSFTSQAQNATRIEAELKFGGTTYPKVYYSKNGLVAGQNYRFALKGDASALPSGRYPWTIKITEVYGTSSVVREFGGRRLIRNESDGIFGPGWSLNYVDRLIVEGSGVDWVRGDGNLSGSPRIPMGRILVRRGSPNSRPWFAMETVPLP